MDTLTSYDKFKFPRGKPGGPADFLWVSAAQLIVCECSRSYSKTRDFLQGFRNFQEIIQKFFATFRDWWMEEL
jgi:hypothetical protein